ncbi:MAG: ATP-grasp domain-containing protein [Planctomycetota bacterium]|nr:ATP-grasp domain-containing protein [Planctomycetota bacterium]
MARLHEYQGKALLAEHGIAIPRGRAVTSADEARAAAAEIGSRAILKVQAWTTSRKAKGGIVFADAPDEAAEAAAKLLGMTFGNFPVTEVLVEETLDIADELFVSLSIDDAARAPVLLLDCHGGSGIEDRAQAVARLPVSATEGVDPAAVRPVVEDSNVDTSLHEQLVDVIVKIADIAGQVEARSLEINPLVTTRDGRIVAADCRVTVDDYAVFRHPELGIEIARELDHPATELERIAYELEKNDHRGTFYFAQLPTEGASDGRGLIGFHGAGGGGSMMSMDAVTNEGFTIANFCDTSGNPSVAKVYRAARIICSQPGLVGYFGSGSGVASQEQYHSAYGLAKAFIELNMSIPVVVRLGGNSEDRAVDILHDACRDLPATIECYRKDDTPAFCAQRFRDLVEQSGGESVEMQRRVPDFVGRDDAYHFPIAGGTVWIDHRNCDPETSAFVLEHAADLLELNQNGKPVLAVSEEDVSGKDSELIACEIECLRAGRRVLFVDMAIPVLDTAEAAAA